MSIKDKYYVEKIPNQETYEWLLKKHYAHRIPSISFAFGLYDINNILKGVCTYGQPASDGLFDICGDKYKESVIELNRLIKEDFLEKNAQSFFVSQTIKMLPETMIIISYSDPNNGHYGYTYQACNFLFTGYGGDKIECFYRGKPIHTRHIKKDEFFKPRNLFFDESKTILDNFKAHNGIVKSIKQKNRYVYLKGSKSVKKDMLENLKYKILPYPKGINQNYDASYEPKVQMKLF